MNKQNPTIAVLMTAHNRKVTTLDCLRRLFNSKITDAQLNVYLVDDGSIDGTGEAVANNYPEVNVINGDGSLFWNRGMWTAWNAAAKGNYDYYLWLNDDTIIFEDAIQVMLQSSVHANDSAVIVGCTCSERDSNKVTYGGANGTLVSPNGNLQEVEHINGNFVLIPSTIYKCIGNLDYYYSHSFGDWDYGVRAKHAGFKLFLSPKFIGTCEQHDKIKKCYDANYSLTTRLRHFFSPLGTPPKELYHAYKRDRGSLYAIKVVLANFLIVFFPTLSKRLGGI